MGSVWKSSCLTLRGTSSFLGGRPDEGLEDKVECVIVENAKLKETKKRSRGMLPACGEGCEKAVEGGRCTERRPGERGKKGGWSSQA
ncbi:UNVERIFIED_CONTAM: hypothetical protein Sradi_3290400 [Sesamum radiatum]|uniref:Uncharacterized protein n=1 Tax=Sesamum radiatum TaxID=300843 RepID=A0AAW2R105_SESRA